MQDSPSNQEPNLAEVFPAKLRCAAPSTSVCPIALALSTPVHLHQSLAALRQERNTYFLLPVTDAEFIAVALRTERVFFGPRALAGRYDSLGTPSPPYTHLTVAA